ncbi:MAG: caspase family protein [Bacteroidales bacterium]|nr:MAG: caspase family protein [Bacteroidales bacterium]
MLKKYILFPGLIIIYSLSILSMDFSYKEKKELKPYNDYVYQAEYSPFRNYFAITIGDNSIEIYDKNWNKIFTHQGNPDSRGGHFSFSPNEKYLAYAKYKSNNDVAVIDLKNKKVVQVLTGHGYFVTDVDFSNDGKLLATSSQDKTARVWKLKDGVFVLTQVLAEHTNSVNGISFSYDNRFLASCGNDSKVVIRELDGGKYEPIQELTDFKGYLRDVEFHPAKNEMITVLDDDLRVWHKPGNIFTLKKAYTGKIGIRTKIRYSPVGEYLVFGYSNRLKIYGNTDEGLNEVETTYRHSEYVFGGTFSQDGKFMVSFSSDKSAVIWEVTGVNPSGKSMIVDYLGDELSSAQKEVLTSEVVSEILKKLSPTLTSPRDEFETSVEFDERRKKLSGSVLLELQKQIERHYNTKFDSRSGTVKIPVQSLIGYNADLEIYKIRFLETEAGVSIPVPEAKRFKKQWEKAHIVAAKKIREDGLCFEYTGFKLIPFNESNTFEVLPAENPFHLKVNGSGGRMYDLAETLVQSKETGKIKTSGQGDKGITMALLFATSIYDSFSDLVNPVIDMHTIAEELRDNYGVNTEVVENATLNETLNKLRNYAKYDYSQSDNLLIFFAGHGNYDEIFNEGYVITSDSKLDDEAKITCLSHSNLRTIVNNVPCNHILLVMDVCFGGTFDPIIAGRSRAADIYADISDEEFISRKQKYKTRLYLTSGGKEYVPDGRPGHHSPFARRFIEGLRNYGGKDGILTINEMLNFIEKVEPQPCFGEFGDNEPGSDFILIAK